MRKTVEVLLWYVSVFRAPDEGVRSFFVVAESGEKAEVAVRETMHFYTGDRWSVSAQRMMADVVEGKLT